MKALIEFVLLGLVAGGVYTLVSLSVVVVYRGSGIINFASGGIALLGASLYYELGRNISTLPAVVLSVLLCAGCGTLIQAGIMRAMRNAAPIAKVVATLGIMAILASAGTLRYGSSNLILVPSFLPRRVMRIAGIAIGQDRVICFAIGLVVVIGLYAVYRYTSFGRATTGVSENERVVAALGRSPDRIALINWSIGSALAGFGGILFVPLVGFSVTAIVMIVLPALSAALVGNFRSFPLAFCGAELVGVLQSLSTKYIASPGWTSAVPFLVIIILLVVRGRALPLRGHVFDRLPKIGSAEMRLGRISLGVAYIVVSLIIFTDDWAVAVTTSMIFALICLSLVVVTGYGGQLSLAQIAFAGVSALTSTRLADVFHVPFIFALLAGVVAAVAVGAIVALPALRVRGANLAVVTLGLAQVITAVVLGNPAYTGGIDRGTIIPDPEIFGWSISTTSHPRRYAIVALVLFIVCALLVRNIRRGRAGRRLLAVRSNERAAMSLGISVTGAKLYAFGTSAGLAAVAGALLGFQYVYVDFTQFSVLSSVQSVLYATIGGIGLISGALQGGAITPNGVIQQIIDHWINLNSARFALIGAIALLPAIIQNRDGIASSMSESWDRVSAWLGMQARSLLPRSARAKFSAAAAPHVATDQLAHVDPGVVGGKQRLSPKVLDVKNLRVRYGGVVAVDDVSLTVRPGEVVGLIGANGAGKTTFIDAVAGLTPNDRGAIRLGGVRVDGLNVRRRAHAGLARSFQSLELFDDLTVEDNLRAATDSRDVWSYFKDLVWPGKAPLPRITRAVIDAFELGPWLHRMPGELPYAQRRLVAIARAVASGPSVLMLDEPASGLDATSTRELARVVRALADDWGMGVLLIEHDVSMVLETSDQIYALDFGRLIGNGSPAEIRTNEQILSAYLGSAPEDLADVPRSADQAVQQEQPRTNTRRVSSTVLGSTKATLAQAVEPSPITTSSGRSSLTPLLEVRGLHSGYASVPVLRDVNLRVGRGEIVALLGANGAGKTTTLLTIAGILSPTSGSIESRGVKLPRGLDRRSRGGMGVVFEEPGIIPSLSTADNLRLGPGGIGLAVELFPELKGLLHRRAALLSGGEQQILTVARALAAEPELLLIDELSLGLAPKIVDRLLRAIRSIADQGNVGVLLVEQRIHTALRYADRAAVLRRGEIVLEGDADRLRSGTHEIAERYF